jgi:hypothetical protein
MFAKLDPAKTSGGPTATHLVVESQISYGGVAGCVRDFLLLASSSRCIGCIGFHNHKLTAQRERPGNITDDGA